MSAKKEPSEKPLAEFLTGVPPGTAHLCPDLFKQSPSGHWVVATPVITLYCGTCKGERFFAHKWGDTFERGGNAFLQYNCKNCDKGVKTYALWTHRQSTTDTRGAVAKYGEMPDFLPPTPSKLFDVLPREDHELFLKGRRSEARGLGIGAFIYYRRVVDGAKDRLLDEISKAAKAQGADDLSVFEEAKKENQFSKVHEVIKPMLPPSLLIKGQSPFLLLYDSLSKGVHEDDDADCLERATAVRVVLIELAERLALALRTNAVLDQAVGKLLKDSNPQGTGR